MKYLLDTHALIWCLEADNQLSDAARCAVNDDSSDIYVSIVSLWEMAIKMSLGKLKLSQPLGWVISSLQQHNVTLLTVMPAHVLAVLNLPFEHRDPFDRLLIAQVMTEDMKFISNESLFLRYGVDRVW